MMTAAQIVVLQSPPPPSRARIIRQDNWDDRSPPSGSGTGDDWIVECWPEAARNGLYGLYCKSRATTPTAGDTVTATITTDLPVPGILEWTGWYRYQVLANVNRKRWLIELHTGGRNWQCVISQYPNSGTVKYQNAAGAAITIDALAQDPDPNVWYYWRLVVNSNLLQYVSATVGEKTADLSGIGAYDAGAAGDSLINWQFSNIAGTAPPLTIHHDDCMIRRLGAG